MTWKIPKNWILWWNAIDLKDECEPSILEKDSKMEGGEALRGYEISPSALGQCQIYLHNSWQVMKGSKRIPNSSIIHPQAIAGLDGAPRWSWAGSSGLGRDSGGPWEAAQGNWGISASSRPEPCVTVWSIFHLGQKAAITTWTEDQSGRSASAQAWMCTVSQFRCFSPHVFLSAK